MNQEAKVSSSTMKAPTGIQGFDEISGGGLPRRRMTLVLGGPGSGKTVFALQTLISGARNENEAGIFVAFEENSQQILQNAHSFGWDIPQLQAQSLFFLDAKLPFEVTQAGPFDLQGILAGLSAKAAEMNAKRIVFDGIDVLLTLLDNPAAERREIYRLYDWLVAHDLTGIITAKTATGQPEPEEYAGFLQYRMDCIIHLRHVTKDNISLRKLRISKYRGSSFFENEVPMLIGPTGIEVIGPELHNLSFDVVTERISTGVSELDTMMSGGYLRGTGILITGVPGTAKSTLAGSFIQAACARGESAVYMSFDENAQELVRNLSSVGILLEQYVQRGTLLIHSSRIESWSAEAHMLELRALIRARQPKCLILDPITAFIKGGGETEAMSVVQRLVTFAKSQGITTMMTSLLASTEAAIEASRLQISTLADTWIHLTYVIRGGERNRALTIVKSRGTHHSNQVRELVLTDQGVKLAEVYTAGGEVLMGTLRWEKEQAEAREKEHQRYLVSQRRLELQVSETELALRLEALQRQLEAQRAELAQLSTMESEQEERWSSHLREIQRLRATDEPE